MQSLNVLGYGKINDECSSVKAILVIPAIKFVILAVLDPEGILGAPLGLPSPSISAVQAQEP